MKNKIKKLGIGIGAALILIGGRIVFSEAGTAQDPLVTRGFVEAFVDSFVEDRVKWVVVDVEEGQSLIGKAGTEIILRSGEATTISKISKTTINGSTVIIDNGLTDVTEGEDLKMGEKVPKDHLLIIPRDDERGVICIAKSVFLVKGNYIIK